MAFWGWLYCQYPCWIGELRFVIAIFAFFVVLLGFTHHAVLNIAIVEMVDHASINSTCPTHHLNEPIVIKDIGGGKAQWSEAEQGYILGAFYLGYFLMHIPAGIICDKWGPKCLLFLGIFISSVTTALIPIGVNMIDTWWIVGILRVITGFGQGTILPGVSSLIMRWFPPLERSTITASILAANSIGMVLGHVCTGMLIHFWEAWPPAFYLWACAGLVFSLLFLVYVFSDPQTHRYLHQSEFDYLQTTMTMKKDIKTPYKLIFKDGCIYGLIIMEMGHDLLLYTLRNNFPKYLNQVLGFNILENSLTGILFLVQWIAGFFGGVIADYLIRKKNVNVTLLRKVYTFFSNFGGFLGICVAVLCECNVVYALSSFGVAIFFKGLFYSGGMVNILEISIHHSGFVMSLVAGVGACMGFACSLLIGLIAKNNSFHEWQLIVAVIGIVEVTSLIFYYFLASSKRRSWDYSEDEDVEYNRPLRKKWYLQLSESDHQLRMEKDKQAHAAMKEAVRTARAKMKEDIRNRRQGT